MDAGEPDVIDELPLVRSDRATSGFQGVYPQGDLWAVQFQVGSHCPYYYLAKPQPRGRSRHNQGDVAVARVW